MNMTLITGPAGTGKTHQLIESIIEWLSSNNIAEFQSVLAITRMHGSRRRIKFRLKEEKLFRGLSVSTVDSFALSVLNRWRRSLALNAPVFPDALGGFRKDMLGYRATFDEIMKSAGDLLQSNNVGKTIWNSHPLVVIDEFQDCTGNQLHFVKELSKHCSLVLAADAFQALNGDESAVDWVLDLESRNKAAVKRLTEPRRTKSGGILRTAEALLTAHPVGPERVPVYYAPKYTLAVWKTIPSRSSGTNAVLYPAGAIFKKLKNAVTSVNNSRSQEGKSTAWFPYVEQVSEEKVARDITCALRECMTANALRANAQVRELYSNLNRIANYRCCELGSTELIEYTVANYIHSMKFCCDHEARYAAMTIHSAKNREFDHVFILWDINHVSNFTAESQRRLLYNAVTRAKKSCVVILLGPKNSISKCPVLCLLGDPLPVIQKSRGKKR